MRFFTKSEFRGWYYDMDRELLQYLDDLRYYLGYAIAISPAKGAIGRHAGKSMSRHNIDRYGTVQAIDVFPKHINPREWISAAKTVGFTGIGFYPDWRPQPGIHLDVRPGRLATWGGVRDTPSSRQKYVRIYDALRKFDKSKKR